MEWSMKTGARHGIIGERLQQKKTSLLFSKDKQKKKILYKLNSHLDSASVSEIQGYYSDVWKSPQITNMNRRKRINSDCVTASHGSYDKLPVNAFYEDTCYYLGVRLNQCK